MVPETATASSLLCCEDDGDRVCEAPSQGLVGGGPEHHLLPPSQAGALRPQVLPWGCL